MDISSDELKGKVHRWGARETEEERRVTSIEGCARERLLRCVFS